MLFAGCLFVAGVSRSEAAQQKGGPVLDKTDELTDKDEKDTPDFLKNSPRKVYKVNLAENVTYQLDLKSKDFDAVLRIEDSTGKQVAFNDDAPGLNTLDSRIVYKAPKGGEYRIIATCLDGKNGKFTLTIVEKGKAGPPKGKVLLSKAEELTDKDEKDTHKALRNQPRKVYKLNLAEGKSYQIDMKSDDVDTVLRLEDPNGTEVAINDDFDPPGLDSRIIYTAPKAGEYRIIATCLTGKITGRKDVGKFTLTVVELDPAGKEAKEAAFKQKLENYAKLAPNEQKQIVLDLTKSLQDKGADLSMTDARTAYQLATAMQSADPEAARQTLSSFVKIFEGASNKQVAGVSRAFADSLKKLEMIGKEIEIAGKTTDGKDFNLKDLKGKVVLVDFWATWCGPCVAEIPNIIEAHKKYNDKGFEVIGVSLDRANDDIIKFVEARKLPWKSINIEDSQKLADKYGINSIPAPILVGRDGRVVSLSARGPELERLLDRLLSVK